MTAVPSFSTGHNNGSLGLRLILVIGSALQAQSYVAGSGYEQGILSRFANVQCELLMTVGRMPNTAMPPEWAASGAKLGLPLDINFSTQECESFDMNRESLLGEAPGAPFLAVEPMNTPTFTSAQGQETVKVFPGAYSCQIQSPETQQHSLRFFLDFPNGASRNDVVLPAERIYFMTSCWNEDNNVLDKAKKYKEDVSTSLDKVNNELEEMGKPSIGSFFQKSFSGYGRYFTLLEQRKKLTAQMDTMDEAFPPQERLFKVSNNLTVLKEGVIAVKRFNGGQEQYHWVGTFTFKKLLNDDSKSI